MATSTLQHVKDKLKSHKVRDVKFLFNADLQSRQPSEVKLQAAALLDTYLQGSFTKPRLPVGKMTHAA